MKKSQKIILAVIISIGLFTTIYFTNPFHLPNSSNFVLGIMVLMLILWFSETLPIGLVALIPLVIFPVMNLIPIDEAALFYIDKIIFLFFGGFVLGLSIEKWNLHKRLALGIVKITGTSPNKIILGFTIAVGFLSMWLSNTATTMMMFPIASSVIALVELNYKGSGKIKNFNLVLMLVIAYASSIGGFATIIGTPPNVVTRGLLKDNFNYDMDFLDWSILAFPLSFILLALTYIILTYIMFPNRMDKNSIPPSLINDEYKKLGKMSRQEWIVALVFIQTCMLWIFRPQIAAQLKLWGLDWGSDKYYIDFKFDDTFIAMIGAIMLFLIPADTNRYRPVFELKDLKKMQWGILLLFGGGLCLAKAMEISGLMNIIGDYGARLGGGNELGMVIILTVIAVFVTEVMSNVALVTVFAPVAGGIAIGMKADPLLFIIPVTIGASCAFMSPIGTPPNAIVYASKKIKLYQMAKAGFVLNIVSSVLICIFCYFFIDVIF